MKERASPEGQAIVPYTTEVSDPELIPDSPKRGLFSQSKPAHVGKGLVQGAGNVATGFLAGAAGLVAAPIAGAKSEGGKGFMKGVGAGVVGAVVLPVAGVVAGAHSVGSGVKNTKKAVVESRKGKEYDKRTGEWVDKDVDLEQEFTEVQATRLEFTKNRFKSSPALHKMDRTDSSANVQVFDTEYYDILGVKPSADASEIRKAYYRLALELHPDRNPDEGSQAKFQAVGEAYQVLADATSRAKYDKYGKEGLDVDFVESGALFALLFGSEKLEPYVGKLQVASAIFGDDLSADERKGAVVDQHFREINLAIQLRDRLIVGQEALKQGPEVAAKWKESWKQTAKELCEESYGGPLLSVIGFCYTNRARYWEGKQKGSLISAATAKWKLKRRRAGVTIQTFKSACRAQQAAEGLSANSSSGDSKTTQPESQYSEQQQEASLNYVVDTCLQICFQDIIETLEFVCKKCMNDKAAGPAERQLRSKALDILGQIFIDASKDAAANTIDVRAQLQRAYARCQAEPSDSDRF